MNTSSPKFSQPLSLKQFNWDALVLAIVAFWLSSSVLLDFLLMPMMYESGMMAEPNFATAGYSLFWLFNRVELLCAGAILTGLLVVRQQRRNQFEVIVSGARSRWALAIGAVLMAIALTYTYILTPQMSALGIHLSGDFSESAPLAMNYMHALYWGLEVVKLVAAAWLVKLCYRDISASFE
ncbi:MAG: hypothetical protein WA885_06705 [Phormidesmis sp.]